MHLILTGATGLVGSGVLDAMLKAKDISRISILSRRPVKMVEDKKDPRVNVIIHKDFEKYDAALLEELRGASGAVWALGASQNAVSKEEYVKITKTYALAAAEAFQKIPRDDTANEPFRFIFVSGEGATHNPGPFTPQYGRVKGETEIFLSEMRKQNPLFHADSVRPCVVDASAHEVIKPYIPQRAPLLAVGDAVLGPVIRSAMKRYSSPTEPLGEFIAGMAMGKFDGKLGGPGVQKLDAFNVVGNIAFRRLMGL